MCARCKRSCESVGDHQTREPESRAHNFAQQQIHLLLTRRGRRRNPSAWKGGTTRISGKLKLGFYPLPLAEAKRIRSFLRFPAGPCSALDPCVGEGTAFGQITSDSNVLRYGVELDASRAEQARTVTDCVIQGSCFDVHCPVDAFSLLYVNPPYDFELSEGHNERMERIFLEHTSRWLKPGGVLILVIPAERMVDCSRTLALQFSDVRIFRLTEPESILYHQVVIFGLRRTRRERDRVPDREIQNSCQYLAGLSHDSNPLPSLLSDPEVHYVVPQSEPVTWVYRGLPLDEIEDLLSASSAYRQSRRVLLGSPVTIMGRPLTPLHGGHVSLLCSAGMLDGIFGNGENRHIAHWQTIKTVDHFEETADDGTLTMRDRERFTHRLSLVFADGRRATLS
ncbi:MAG: DUF6094 domain-containing protein [Acidobacteria bacterium]|nr:DUF6094 domain-containing protein [Acidobacteriota bacterium]MCI0621662.1 DUF6094 domain-containing protein [Acidobacteriota bacterium]MCI0722250.1 DUF6094 domain-containing protein [Acidobacteriota bacterium]